MTGGLSPVASVHLNPGWLQKVPHSPSPLFLFWANVHELFPFRSSKFFLLRYHPWRVTANRSGLERRRRGERENRVGEGKT